MSIFVNCTSGLIQRGEKLFPLAFFRKSLAKNNLSIDWDEVMVWK